MEKSDNFGNLKRECIIRGTSEIIITENGEAVLYKVSDNSKFMTSNIFAARITEYAPQLNSYFVDIGDGSRRALLPVSDIMKTTTKQLCVGDFCLAQITSAPRGKKGAQISTQIRLAGVYTVLLPCEKNININISGKIRDCVARERLAALGESFFLDSALPEYSMIFRTESKTASAKEIIGDYSNLCDFWQSVLQKYNSFVSVGRVGLIYERNPILSEILKYPISSYTKVSADTTEMLDKIKSEFSDLIPKLEFIPNRIFSVKSVDNVVPSLLGRRVYLKSGADIIIEKTEALTVIDVNSSKSNLSYHKVNLEAATEIMRQLRLRDIGGIIICDFIEPENKKDRPALVEFMRGLACIDPSKPEIAGITQLGLIEISRKRS